MIVDVQQGSKAPAFLAGVIEGFYGKPWSRGERMELFDWMADWGLSTYLYAPKDDLKHRALWREPYNAKEAEALDDVVQACKHRGLQFVYAISPGLTITYTRAADLDALKGRFAQMLKLGCRDFCVLFDDIPETLNLVDLERWGSLAAAQCGVTNELFRWLREQHVIGRFLFCPTPYCGRMAGRDLGGATYLPTVGRELLPEIDVFWTGPEIISREITVEHVRWVQSMLRRKPTIWDNLHANDYDGHRFFCGPYSGRAPELRDEVSGILTNPNNEFPLNYVPLRTLGEFTRCDGTWNARSVYRASMQAWLKHFATAGAPVTFEDFIQFGDCYYLPHEEGPEAEALYNRVRALLTSDPSEWGEAASVVRQQAGRLRALCVQFTELRDRALFHALSRRIWELREELDLLDLYIACRSDPGTASEPCHSDFHLPRTYRGGMVARMQRLLRQEPDGSFVPSERVDRERMEAQATVWKACNEP